MKNHIIFSRLRGEHTTKRIRRTSLIYSVTSNIQFCLNKANKQHTYNDDDLTTVIDAKKKLSTNSMHDLSYMLLFVYILSFLFSLLALSDSNMSPNTKKKQRNIRITFVIGAAT